MLKEATKIGKLYIKMQKEMDVKYRDALILMEIGKFYEVYTFENTETGEEIGKAKQMSRICNIQLTRKNKNLPVSFSNPHMCGFPSHSLSRFVSHLVENGKTVVVCDQDEGKDGKMDRLVKAVYSPSVMTGLEEEEIYDKERSILAVETSWMDKRILVVIVHVNTSSGKIMYEEEWLDEPEARSFILNILELHNPSEILYKGVLTDCFQDRGVVHPIPEWKKDNRKFCELEFQEAMLSKVYPGDRHLSVIEEIGLERNPDVLPVLCFTLSFLYDHLPLVVFRIEKPVRLSRSGVVCFHPHSLQDLNIFSKKNESQSLFGLLDQTVTPGGKKLLRKTMFSPIYDIEKLRSSHQEIEHFLSLEKEPDLKKLLTYHHIDLDHHFRRLQIGNIGVLSLYRLLISCIELKEVVHDMGGMSLALEARNKEEAWSFLVKDGLEKWDLNLMQAWKSWDTSTIWKSTPPSLRDQENDWILKEKKFKDWLRSSFGSDAVSRLTFSEEEAFLQMTKKMFMEMKRPEGMRQKTMSSGIRVYHKKMDEYFLERRSFLHQISSARKNLFREETADFLTQHEETMRFILDFVSRLDLIQCYAKNARKYKLNSPELVEDDRNTFIDCQQVRHLVVEAANPKSKYIPNDVRLSHMLLFGQNSAGKCFKKGSKMIRYDGSFCTVEDLRVGDLLIGEDGEARTILCLTEGRGMLYDIVNESTGEVLMTVNNEHILCLTDPDRSRIVEARVQDILDQPKIYKSLMFQCTGKPVPPRKFPKEPVSKTKYLEMLKCGHRFRLDSEGDIQVLPKTHEIVPFSIQKHGEDDFFGFGIDGNQRFLLPDGTLAHNSTLMKSVGVSVLMAQCGMFVPCSKLCFTPIRSLFTKIGSRDDIWKGKSTFITEMTELRHMLERSDHHSLILCDEPTSGTETFSATGIVASSLNVFLEKKAMFIMTTHLHTLKNFRELMEDQRLQVKHLSMEYDPMQKKLVFDRILRDGFGKSIYGLEIAEYLGFSPDFLKKAYEYRNRLETEQTSIVPKKRSRYNSKKWVEKCEACGSIQDLHTHHIEPQAIASKDGYIGTFHKNRLSNLKILCRDCHEKEHHPST